MMNNDELRRLFEESFSLEEVSYSGAFDHDSFLQLRRDICAYEDEDIGREAPTILYEFLINNDMEFIDSVLRLFDIYRMDPYGRARSSVEKHEADLRKRPFDSYSSAQKNAVSEWLVYLHDLLESELDRFQCDSAILYWGKEEESGASRQDKPGVSGLDE